MTEKVISPFIAPFTVATKAFPVPAQMSPLFGNLNNLDAEVRAGRMLRTPRFRSAPHHSVLAV